LSSWSSSSSNDPNWDVEYYAYNDYEPDNVNQANKWQKEAAGSYTTAVEADVDCNNGKRFRLDTPPGALGDKCFYSHETAGEFWPDNVSNANGYQIEARIKVIDGGVNYSQTFWIEDGAYVYRIIILTNKIEVDGYWLDEATQSYSHDFTADYHTIKIEVIGTSLVIKVDGTTRITGTLAQASGSTRLRWGDDSIPAYNGGEVYWDYIRYNCD